MSVSVCPSASISPEPQIHSLTKSSLRLAAAVARWRSDTVTHFRFVDDVIISITDSMSHVDIMSQSRRRRCRDAKFIICSTRLQRTMVKVKENSGSQPTAAVKVVGLSVNMGLFQARIKARRGDSGVLGVQEGGISDVAGALCARCV